MVPARNNAKRLSSVNNITKAIHHHHHHHHHHLCKALLGVILGMHKSKVRLKFFILLKRFGDNYEQSTVFIFWKKKDFSLFSLYIPDHYYYYFHFWLYFLQYLFDTNYTQNPPKHLSWSFLAKNMVAHSLVIKSELDPGVVVCKCFLVKFEKFLRIAFFTEHFLRLLLCII